MPGLNIQRSPDATEDIRLQTIWYDEHAGKEIAERYVSSFMETAFSLGKQPDLGRICHFRSRKLANLRCFRMEGAFGKHLVFYRVIGDTLYVFRVLHGMRDLPRRLLDPPGTE